MKFIFFLFASILVSNALLAQTAVKDESVYQENEFIIGIVTEDPQDFYEVKALLEGTHGIVVENFCFQDKLIKLHFNKEKFKELNEIFELIQGYFIDAQCYKKEMGNEKYWSQCGGELNKQNIK